MGLRHLGNHAVDRGTVDAVGIVAHQGFAGQFEQDALIRLGVGHMKQAALTKTS